MKDMREIAKKYAEYGLATFPLQRESKFPIAKTQGHKDASANMYHTKELWEHRRYCNLGIATGSVSRNLVVIDIDDKPGKNGLDLFNEWCSIHGKLPVTLAVDTPSGGLHLYYFTDEPMRSAIGMNGWYIDIKGEGGYVLGAPSVNGDGIEYTPEINDETGDYDEIAKATSIVYEFIEYCYSQSRMDKVCSDGESNTFELPESIDEGERDFTLYRYACSLWAKSWKESDLIDELRHVNETKCHPPLPDHVVMAKVKSAMKRPQGYSDKVKKNQLSADNAGGKNQTVPTEVEAVYLVNEVKSTVSDVRKMLFKTEDGKIKQTIANCMIAIECDPNLAGKFFFDELGYCDSIIGPVPWDSREGVRPLNRSDHSGLASYLEINYNLNSKNKAVDALSCVVMRNQRNMITEWLDTLEWDGEKRIGTLLPLFLGCDPTDYNTEVMTLAMVAAVARAYKPGIKFDYMPVLKGPQGYGKSSFLLRLGHCPEWYLDNLNTVEGYKAAEQLRGMWIVELAELMAVTKQKEIEAVKSFVTLRKDNIRPPYAINTELRPRMCVLFGTTNKDAFLTDPTGNRRFWPVECGIHERIYNPADDEHQEYFDMAWAEAVHIYKTEHPKLILSPESEAIAFASQAQSTEDDPRLGLIQQYLDNKIALAIREGERDANNIRVCIPEILENSFNIDRSRIPAERKLISELHEIMVMKMDGWVKYPTQNGKARCGEYGIQRCYVPVQYLLD